MQVAFGKLESERLRAMAENAIRGPAFARAWPPPTRCTRRRGARDGAARRRPRARQQPEDVDLARRRAADRRDGPRGPQAARHPHRRRVPQRHRHGARGRGSINASSTFRPPRSRPGSASTCSGSWRRWRRRPGALRRAPDRRGAIEQFEDAGGAQAGAQAPRAGLDTTALTCTGTPLAENLAGYDIPGPEVIRPLDRPVPDAAIVVLHGSLRRDRDRQARHPRAGPPRRSPARRASSRTAPRRCRRSRTGRVQPGDVLVARDMGLKGGPGDGRPGAMILFALDAAGPRDHRLRHRRPAVGPVPEGHHGRRGLARGRRRRPAGARRRTATRSRSTPTPARSSSTSTRTSWRAGASASAPPSCRARAGTCRSTSAACSRCRRARCWSRTTDARGVSDEIEAPPVTVPCRLSRAMSSARPDWSYGHD